MTDVATIIEHLKPMAADMRISEIKEVKALGNRTPIESITRCFTESKICRTLFRNGKIVGMYGLKCDDAESEIGCVWFLGTNELNKHRKWFMRESRKYINSLLEIRPTLANFVDSRYAKALDWLEWCGFTIDTEHEHFFHDPDVPFFCFHIRKES